LFAKSHLSLFHNKLFTIFPAIQLGRYARIFVSMTLNQAEMLKQGLTEAELLIIQSLIDAITNAQLMHVEFLYGVMLKLRYLPRRGGKSSQQIVCETERGILGAANTNSYAFGYVANYQVLNKLLTVLKLSGLPHSII
jgi:hypothetical protein